MGPAPTDGPSDSVAPQPARYVLRDRAVRWFLDHPYEPGGAIPNAILRTIGGPMMWSDRPVLPKQFTADQRRMVLDAAQEIWDLYLAAGGSVSPEVEPSDIGLMPVNASQWEYQSEEWAAAKAVNAGQAIPNPDDEIAPSRKEELRLARSYHMVITWIDYVKGGLLDASAVYDDEDEEPERSPEGG